MAPRANGDGFILLNSKYHHGDDFILYGANGDGFILLNSNIIIMEMVFYFTEPMEMVLYF